jgi:hypothetical protein
MKYLIYCLISIGLLVPGGSFAQNSTTRQHHVVERGENHRVWESYTPVAESNGEKIYQTNRVVELASGLHYWDGKAWVDSKEEIEIVGNKAVARHGNHKVTFAGNLMALGAVEVNAQDGKKFRSQVMGLSYYDTKTGESVLIAEVKSSEGFILPPNHVIYVDAFTDVKADVRYTYTKAGLEQDIILREAPPSPAEFGLDPATTRLEVMTEFLQPPAVSKQLRVMRPEEDGRTRRGMVAPDFVDEVLDFGTMKMGGGKAFQLDSNGQSAGSTVPVAKQWQQLEGRDFLIEAVQYPTIRVHLESLPPAEAKVKNRQDLQKNKAIAGDNKTGQPAKRVIPRKLVADATGGGGKPIQIADFKQIKKGVVLDYLLLSSSATNMTFAGDTTYLVSGEVVLEGTTTFEGGAVIKYTNNVANSRLRLKGTVVWDTAPYRPAIFTALDDNTVGENITSSTGSPTNYYASTALLFDNGLQNDIKHIRVSHAATAIDGVSVSVSHGQFVNSGNGLSLSGNTFSLRNVLFSGVMTNIYSSLAVTGALEHVTFNRANFLAATATNSLLLMTNSLIYSVTNYGPFSWLTNQVAVVGGSSPFTNVGSGWHYLPTNSPYLNVGTTNISASLRQDFAQTTTQRPEIFTNTVNTNITLAARGIWDTNQPDLGYHYWVIDYAAGACTVTNATLTLTNGVTFGTFDLQGLGLVDGSRLVSEGSPKKLNRFVRYSAVQEGPGSWGASSATLATINPYIYGTNAATVKYRFTEFNALNGDWHFYTGYNNANNWRIADLDIRDCFFYGGYCLLAPGPQTNTNFRLINNLFVRTKIEYKYDSITTILNNTFSGGAIGVYFNTLTNLLLRDCALIDCKTTRFFVSAGLSNDHNAYINQTNYFVSTGTGDILTNIAFVAGPLGNYCQTSNSPLINAGSQSATNVGLYHYTTTTNQIRETNSIVDMGFHYVALDVQGNPIDTDGDGIPDYLEDVNGNGIADAGETDWKNRDSDYDGINDGAELLAGTNPLSQSSTIPTRLGYWRFNTTNLLGEAGQIPTEKNELAYTNTWSGSGIRITNLTSRVRYRDVETNGHANINFQNGTVRFWFRPDWTSESGGGSGTTYWSRFLQVGNWTSDASSGMWNLGFYPSGDVVYLQVQANGNEYVGIGASTTFISNNWYEITVTYTATNSAIYINGALKASGGGAANIPSAAVRADGFTFGNSGGWEPCKGILDELETFNYPLSAAQIASDYAAKFQDSDYDGRTDWQEWEDGTDPYNAGSVVQMRLGYWKFNNTNWLGESGQIPLVATNLSNPASWNGNALGIDSYSTNLHLLNVDISGSTPTTMTGPAAIGLRTNDFWNTYYGSGISLKTIANLVWSDQSTSSVSLTLTNAQGSWGMSAATGNRMYDDYNYPSGYYGEIGVTVSNLAAGYYDCLFYCHGAASDQNAEIALYSGTNLVGGKFTGVTSDWMSTNWIEGKQYVRFYDVNIASNTLLKAWILPDASSYAPFNGLQVIGKKIAQLKYREQEYLGNANINVANGTVSFWYKPNWIGTNASGVGPKKEIRLIDVGFKTADKSNGWWGIVINKEGTMLSLDAQGNGVDTNYLAAPLNWTNSVWHQIVITYTATNSILYIDGVSMTNGVGVTTYPGSAVRASGFSVGSDYNGLKQAEGQIDELETYNYALSSGFIESSFGSFDLDGDGLTNAQEAILGTNPNLFDSNGNGISDANEDFDGDGLPNSGEFRCGTDPFNPDTNGNGVNDYYEDHDGDGLVNGYEVGVSASNPSNPHHFSLSSVDANYLFVSTQEGVSEVPNRVQYALSFDDDNYYIDLVGLEPGTAHDIYFIDIDHYFETLEWEYTPIVFGAIDQTHFVVPRSTIKQSFFFFTSASAMDADGDGLSDGYELLVTDTVPTNPDSNNNGTSDGAEDFDGDGLSNLLETSLRSNPFKGDTDGDGISDFEEYTFGTNPALFDSPFVLMITAPAGYTLLP